jgi:hypothetical protein
MNSVRTIVLPTPDAREDGDAPELLDGVVDELGEDHRLAHTRPPKDGGTSPSEEGAKQIDDLDPRLVDLRPRTSLTWRWGWSMKGTVLRGGDRRPAVERASLEIDDTSEQRAPDWHGQRQSRAPDLGAAFEPPSGVDGYRANARAADVRLHDSRDERVIGQPTFDGRLERRDRARDVDLDDGAADDRDATEQVPEIRNRHPVHSTPLRNSAVRS